MPFLTLIETKFKSYRKKRKKIRVRYRMTDGKQAAKKGDDETTTTNASQLTIGSTSSILVYDLSFQQDKEERRSYKEGGHDGEGEEEE